MKTPGVASVFQMIAQLSGTEAGVCLGPGRYICASEVHCQMQFERQRRSCH